MTLNTKPVRTRKSTGKKTKTENPTTLESQLASGEHLPTNPANEEASPLPTPKPSPGADIGRPDCPLCAGLGFLRRDLPIGHPDFGKLEICSCRQGEVNQVIHERLFALSRLEQLGHLTFENFLPRGRVGLTPRQADSLENAYNQARLYVQHLKGWLFLKGGYGCGKTHLAAAIANEAVSLGIATLFITVPDMLDSLRFAYNDPEETFEKRFDDIRQAPLLILDDFGTQNATAWAQEKLFQIINSRYINHLPLVVTSNLELDQIEGRIRSRLEDPGLVTPVRIIAPDFRQPAGSRTKTELSSLDLLHNRTFANFDLRKNENLPADQIQSLEKAFKAAQKFANQPSGWLVFIGDYGSGKTHLVAAIGNSLQDAGYEVILISTPDLFDYLRATFNSNSTVSLDRRFDELRNAPLLILDDMGTESASPWVREKLYQLLNYRYNNESPTVITTVTEMENMDARLRSRMLDKRLCTIHAITVPAYRGVAHPGRRGKTKRPNST